MRHGKKTINLGRKSAHRKSMLANMACSLIEHKRINTTSTKAKALKRFIEPIITKSKSDTTHNRRLSFSLLRDKEAVSELFREIASKVGDRPGGYTRIIKLGNRLGDNADMSMIELVDFNEVYKTDEKVKKKSRRRGGKSKSVASTADSSNTVTLEDEKGAVPELEEKIETVVQNSAPEKEAEVKKTKVKKSENKDGE
ncbi:MAG: 50S ribosomal protein L17 [Flavobacteriales bacterium TMED235]|nr:50S ribosomal protein L17 [Flavobacteriaceae bacterium]RPG56875.1 MAG: 50S ribosomal protein L17 [Flavobacteriales bacterium TMED235]